MDKNSIIDQQSQDAEIPKVEDYKKIVNTIYSIECRYCGYRYANRDMDHVVATVIEAGWKLVDKGVICTVCVEHRL